MKFSYGKTALLGLGFFVITLTWALYNAYVPIFLFRYLSSGFLVGFIMTLDNIAAITLQPYFGAKSDVTQTQFGRRMPYLLIGMPISAIAFALIPLGYLSGLAMLVAAVLVFNGAMSIYRAPTIALMPDLTPPTERSKANGVINLMGGLGGVLAFFAGAKLYEADPRLPFVLSGVLMVLVIIVLYLGIKEPDRRETDKDGSGMGIMEAFVYVLKEEEKSTFYLLLAILFWFMGYGAVEAFFTAYGVFHLGITESAAALSLGFFSLSFLVFAVPSGFIATRIGRRKTILIGLVGLIFTFGCLNFMAEILPIRILLLIAGFFWALVNINSYPMVVDMTTEKNIGVYTGLYYFYSSLAAILSPMLFGAIRDLLGFGPLFIYALLFFILAAGFTLMVRRGEISYN